MTEHKIAEERAREIVCQALDMLQVRGVGGLQRHLMEVLPAAITAAEREAWTEAGTLINGHKVEMPPKENREEWRAAHAWNQALELIATEVNDRALAKEA